MLSNIIVVILCVIAGAAGFIGWWMEKGDNFPKSNKDVTESVPNSNETERKKKNEKD